MVNRLRKKVLERTKYGEPEANTTIPFYDIDYFSVYDVFLKPLQEQGKTAEEVYKILTPHMRAHPEEPAEATGNTPPIKADKLVANPIKEAPADREDERSHSPPVKTSEDLKKKDSDESKAKIQISIVPASPMKPHNQEPPKFDLFTQSPQNKSSSEKTEKETNPNNPEEIPAIQIPFSISKHSSLNISTPVKHDEQVDHDDPKVVRKTSLNFSEASNASHGNGLDTPPSRRNSLLGDPGNSASTGPKQAGQHRIPLPRMLSRIISSENVDALDDKPLQLQKSVSADERSPKTPLTPGDNPNSKSIKAALNITTKSISLLYRLSRTLQKKELLESYLLFDKNIHLLKSIFGLQGVNHSVLEIKNQCLSKVSHFFVIPTDIADKLNAEKKKKIEEMKEMKKNYKKDPAAAKLSYFEVTMTADANEPFQDSKILNKEVVSHIEKFIPSYIRDHGWELLYSRVRDGASYSK